ncbi:retention module-containing protein, partial [Colwellia sp. E150_009]
METYTNPQNAQVIDISGDVRSSLATNLLQVGDTVESGAVLMLAKNSEITVVLADGSHQRVYSSGDELSNEILVENVSVAGSEKVLENSSVEDADMNNIQNEIEAIQDLIASEDDVELPDTAAGVTSNEGTSFVTVDRTGDETLAEAGYDTSEQQNSLPEIGELDVISLTSIVDDDEAVSTDEDTLITGNTLNSAQNSDLAVTGFEVNGVTYAVGSTASLVEGELTLNSDGSYTFLPSDNYNGDVPVATYTVENSTGDRDISTLSIVVEPVIDLADDEEIVSNNEDTTITGDVLINASSPDDPLSVTGFEVGGETYEIGDTANLEEGDLTLNEDGSYTFVPTENYNGPVPVATYTVLDGAGDQVTSTLTIVIDPVSDLIDEDEVVSIEEDTTLTGNVLNNASSPDNPLSVNGFEIGGETYNIGDTAILDEGELTINSDGSYTFVPADDYHGDVPVATYTVEDGAGDTDISTLTITVQSVKDLTDDDEVVSIDEDTTVTGNVLNNASSPDEPLTVTDFEIGGVTYAIGATVSIVEGDLTINADGSYSFVPSENYNGDVPVATYTVEDGAGDTDISTLTITVNPVSDLTDGDEAVRINENTSAIGNVLNNASTPDNPLSVTDFTVGGTQYAIGSTAVLSEGNLTINANGSYVFVPSNDYVGVVPVATYTVTDGAGDTDLSSLRITVDGGGNIPPVAADDSFSVDQGETVSGNVITHNDGDGVVDTDGGDGATLTVTHVNGNALVFDASTGYATITLTDGTLRINAQGGFDYTDTSNDGSNASFNYTLSDGTDSDTA